ncbi:MAG TPA: hypothetical protein VGG31_02090 [Candidatus Dormibacteraeota bacterium]
MRLGQVLSQVARPHRCDDAIPAELQANLWELGVSCDPRTPRQDLIAQLWARKRTLAVATEPLWGGPGSTPPAAA